MKQRKTHFNLFLIIIFEFYLMGIVILLIILYIIKLLRKNVHAQ